MFAMVAVHLFAALPLINAASATSMCAYSKTYAPMWEVSIIYASTYVAESIGSIVLISCICSLLRQS